MVYRTVGGLAEFDTKYRVLDEVFLNSPNFEASASVKLKEPPSGSDFVTRPCLVDGLSQIGGFVMNGNDDTDHNKEIFVNHGCKSFVLFEDLRPEEIYSTYVKMTGNAGKKTWFGDVFVFRHETLIGLFESLEVGP